MKCPICPDVDLVITERQNIEIDYCPKCRGVWLDRGELDKIIEKSAADMPQAAPTARPDAAYDAPLRHGQHGDGYGKHGGGYGKHGYRRKSWLSEIFD